MGAQGFEASGSSASGCRHRSQGEPRFRASRVQVGFLDSKPKRTEPYNPKPRTKYPLVPEPAFLWRPAKARLGSGMLEVRDLFFFSGSSMVSGFLVEDC